LKTGEGRLVTTLWLLLQVKETEPEENDAAQKVQAFFKTVAGDDMEIDWSELKEVLDLALKKGTQNWNFVIDLLHTFSHLWFVK
jgi:hypothetical protein